MMKSIEYNLKDNRMFILLSHILSYDIWFYMTHRCMHMREYWWIHEEHHEADEPNWLDAHRGHIIENVILFTGYCIPMLFGFYDLYQSPIAFCIISIRGWLRHDTRTAWFDGGHHLYHHKVYNRNYGEPWLDYLFGTYTKPPTVYKI